MHPGVPVCSAASLERRPPWVWRDLLIFRRSGAKPGSASGRPFTHIWAPSTTGAFQWTALGTTPAYGTANVSYIDTDTTLDRFYNPQWWVSEVAINGDTGGGDVGGCGPDDSYMNVRLPAIWFWY